MTIIAPTFGGPIKRQIIQRAYGMLGQSSAEFELTPEEYDIGLQAANDIAAQLPETLGWNTPYYANGSPDDESGLAAVDVLGFTARVALEVAQTIGKQWSPNGMQARAISELDARYRVTPSMMMGRNTIRGAGNRRRWFGPYFRTTISDNEPVQ